MNIQLIAIYSLLASVLPLSLFMIYFGIKQIKAEAKEILTETKTDVVEKIKERIATFKLNKDESYIYMIEGKFNLNKEQISEVLKSVK